MQCLSVLTIEDVEVLGSMMTVFNGYRRINLGVSNDPSSYHNPFKFLLENCNKDYLIVVELDVDSHQLAKLSWVQQLFINYRFY